MGAKTQDPNVEKPTFWPAYQVNFEMPCGLFADEPFSLTSEESRPQNQALMLQIQSGNLAHDLIMNSQVISDAPPLLKVFLKKLLWNVQIWRFAAERNCWKESKNEYNIPIYTSFKDNFKSALPRFPMRDLFEAVLRQVGPEELVYFVTLVQQKKPFDHIKELPYKKIDKPTPTQIEWYPKQEDVFDIFMQHIDCVKSHVVRRQSKLMSNWIERIDTLFPQVDVPINHRCLEEQNYRTMVIDHSKNVQGYVQDVRREIKDDQWIGLSLGGYCEHTTSSIPIRRQSDGTDLCAFEERGNKAPFKKMSNLMEQRNFDKMFEIIQKPLKTKKRMQKDYFKTILFENMLNSKGDEKNLGP